MTCHLDTVLAVWGSGFITRAGRRFARREGLEVKLGVPVKILARGEVCELIFEQ